MWFGKKHIVGVEKVLYMQTVFVVEAWRKKKCCVGKVWKVLNKEESVLIGRRGECVIEVLESRQEQRQSDWSRRERGVFEGSKESRARLVEEWAKRQSSAKLQLAAVSVPCVFKILRTQMRETRVCTRRERW